MLAFEVCVESVAGARAAAVGGADRIELCAALAIGGMTPSAGLIDEVVDVIATHVLIRPRGGDFCFDTHEIRIMEKDIKYAIDRGAKSVVIGALTEDGDIDLPTMLRLLAAAGNTPVTFHRAFDFTRDPLAALDNLLELGVDRLLTSGGAPTALEGVGALAEYVRRAGQDLRVMPGSGVTPANIAAIIAGSKVSDIHFSAKKIRPSFGQVAGHTAGSSARGRLQVGPLDGVAVFMTSPELVRATIRAASPMTLR